LPRQKRNVHLYEFAKRGAEARFRDVVDELKQLVGLFPHLRDSFDPDELPIRFILAKGAHRAANRVQRQKPARRRRRMSAEAREKIRQAQLKRWAKQRAAAKK
jgi:hypothetical protein